MNRQRDVLILGVLIVGLLVVPMVCLIMFLLWHFADTMVDRRLASENYSMIRDGMSQAKVEELLGGPPRNYGRYFNGGGVMTMEGYWAPPGAVERIWCDDSNRFEIYFDPEGRVIGHHRRFGYSQEPPEYRQELPEGILRRLLRVSDP
jgi:hypothetical protein